MTEALDLLVEPLTRGDPMSPLRWTCKSTARLAGALTAQGWPVSATTVGKLLHGLGYRLHALQKAREGAAHPDRNAQFEYINACAADCIAHEQPVRLEFPILSLNPRLRPRGVAPDVWPTLSRA